MVHSPVEFSGGSRISHMGGWPRRGVWTPEAATFHKICMSKWKNWELAQHMPGVPPLNLPMEFLMGCYQSKFQEIATSYSRMQITRKVYQLRTMEIYVGILRKTMMRIVYQLIDQLIDHSWNGQKCLYPRIFVPDKSSAGQCKNFNGISWAANPATLPPLPDSALHTSAWIK